MAELTSADPLFYHGSVDGDFPPIPPSVVKTPIQMAKAAAKKAAATVTQNVLSAAMSAADYVSQVNPSNVFRWGVYAVSRVAAYRATYRAGGWHLLWRELNKKYSRIQEQLLLQLSCCQTWPEVRDVLRSQCRMPGDFHQKAADAVSKRRAADEKARKLQSDSLLLKLFEGRKRLAELMSGKVKRSGWKGSDASSDSSDDRAAHDEQRRDKDIYKLAKKVDVMERELKLINTDDDPPPVSMNYGFGALAPGHVGNGDALRSRIEERYLLQMAIELLALTWLTCAGYDDPVKKTPKPWKKGFKSEAPPSDVVHEGPRNQRIADRSVRIGKVSHKGTFQYDSLFLRLPITLMQSWFDKCKQEKLELNSDAAQAIIKGWAAKDLDDRDSRDEYTVLTDEQYAKSIRDEAVAEEFERRHAERGGDEDRFLDANERLRQEKEDYLDPDFQQRIGLEAPRVNLVDKTLQAKIAEAPKCERCGEPGHVRFSCRSERPFQCGKCAGAHHSDTCKAKKCATCGRWNHQPVCKFCSKKPGLEARVSPLTERFVEMDPAQIAYLYQTDDPKKVVQTIATKVGEAFCMVRHTEIPHGVYSAQFRRADGSLDPKVYEVRPRKVFDADAQMIDIIDGKQPYNCKSWKYARPLDGEALFVGLFEPLQPLELSKIGIKPCNLAGGSHTANTTIGHCGGFLLQNSTYVGVHAASETRNSVVVNVFTRVDPTPGGGLGFFRSAMR